jgi:hypothetical protein
MVVDAGLWMLAACSAALIVCGCIFTTPDIKLQILRLDASDKAAGRH